MPKPALTNVKILRLDLIKILSKKLIAKNLTVADQICFCLDKNALKTKSLFDLQSRTIILDISDNSKYVMMRKHVNKYSMVTNILLNLSNSFLFWPKIYAYLL